MRKGQVLTTNGTYPWSFVTHIFQNGHLSHGGDRKTDDFNLTNLTNSNPSLIQ